MNELLSCIKTVGELQRTDVVCSNGLEGCGRQSLLVHNSESNDYSLIRICKHTTLPELFIILERWLTDTNSLATFACWMAYASPGDAVLSCCEYQDQSFQPLLTCSSCPDQLVVARLAEIKQAIQVPRKDCLLDELEKLMAEFGQNELPTLIELRGSSIAALHPQAEQLADLVLSINPSQRHCKAFSTAVQQLDRSIQRLVKAAHPVPEISLSNELNPSQYRIFLHVLSQLLWNASPGLGLGELGFTLIKTPAELDQYLRVMLYARVYYAEAFDRLEVLRDRLESSCRTRDLLKFADHFSLPLDRFLQAARKQTSPYCDLPIEELLKKIDLNPKKKGKRRPKKPTQKPVIVSPRIQLDPAIYAALQNRFRIK